MEASGDTHVTTHADRNTTPGRLSPDTTGRDRNAEDSLSSLNVVHQRRRVNPESLALRLGPDLVRDLDALITPGNTEMPSFAVRKELQERYSIDRRHIYDYFHSRGLRVVKEDKHGPITTKDLPTALPNLRPLRQAPIKNTRPYPAPAERKLFKPRGITKAKLPGRPKKTPGSITTNDALVTCETNESIGAVSEHSSPVAVHPTYVTVNPLLPYNPLPLTSEADENCTFSPVVNPLDESFSVRRAIGDVAYAYRHKSVFERMQELADYPVKCDELLSWNETSPCSTSAEGLLVPHAKPLTRDERRAIYEALSDSIGPAHGIQEYQGTYRKHMEARTKLYFEGLLSVPCRDAQQSAGTSTFIDRKVPLGTNEFRHWLSETRFLKRDVNGSPRLHPGRRNASVVKHQDVVEMQFYQRSIPCWLHTLDELFPTPGGNLDKDDPLADSAIVGTREVAWTTALGDDASDRGLCSAISTSSVSSLPAAETRLAGQAQAHGSLNSGPQEVTGGTDTQWPGQGAYAAYPGHHPALGDRLRRGRNVPPNSRNHLSPRKHAIRDLDKTRARPVTSCDARRRTTSAAGDI